MPHDKHLPPVRAAADPRRGVTERTLLIWFFVAVAFVMLVTGGLLFNGAVWSKRAEAKIAQLSEAGYPVLVGDLIRRHEGAMPEVNAADIYQKAFAAARWTTAGFDSALLPLFGHAASPKAGEPLPIEMLEEIGLFLKQNSETLGYLFEASDLPECLFALTFDSDGDILREYVGSMRGGARLLALKVLCDANSGRPAEAAEASAAIFRMSDHLRGDLFLISAFTRFAILGIGVAQLPWALDSQELSEEELVRLQEAIAATEDEFILGPILPTEIAGGIHFFRTGYPEKPGPKSLEESFGSVLMAVYRMGGQTDRDLLDYLEQMEGMIESARLPLAQRTFPVPNHVAPRWRALLGEAVFADQLLSGMDRLFELEKKNLANVRAALVAVAASRYRVRHGHYPGDLSELVEGFLQPWQIVDPFTNGPLGYTLDDEGFTVVVQGEILLEVKGGEATDAR